MKIQSVDSMSAAAREAHSPRAEEADERLTGSEKGGTGLVAKVEALHGRCKSAEKRTAPHNDDTSMIKESLDQFRGRASRPQQSSVPALQRWLLIVWEFSPLLDEFCAKLFNLLSQDSRDRFGARKFSRRCDGQATTLTSILDTTGNVFCGLTHAEWESKPEPSSCRAATVCEASFSC
jgi:hypothetical protein